MSCVKQISNKFAKSLLNSFEIAFTMAQEPNRDVVKTRVLPVQSSGLGKFNASTGSEALNSWTVKEEDYSSLEILRHAAKYLRENNIPVGFPTETVYGLGADATRSEAVRGIFKTKGRPADNPLIIHISDLSQLRSLLLPSVQFTEGSEDPIPSIYKPLIERFWPGALTILLKNPEDSILAPEVTAGLPTFGARMPDSELALSLIKLAGVPIAAPSANASTKPSTTTAAHVAHDLDGRIELIIDGGPCDVGVESTVVDGLHHPPLILRPGGVSIDAIRECKGWEHVEKGYQDSTETTKNTAPRAPGMKYKHYSPKAKVILYEVNTGMPVLRRRPDTTMAFHFGSEELTVEEDLTSKPAKIGVVRSKTWRAICTLHSQNMAVRFDLSTVSDSFKSTTGSLDLIVPGADSRVIAEFMGIELGTSTAEIARGLFSAFRHLDLWGADVIFVEGIEDEGDIAAAIMNRLRKAATEVVK